MSLKRNKKQTVAIRQSAMHPTKTVTLVKAAPQPVLVATPVLSPKAARRDAHGRFLAKQST
jgi:hypothetical protein